MAIPSRPTIMEAPLVSLSDRVFFLRWLLALFEFARQKPLGAFGGVVVLILIFLGIFGGVLAPYRYDAIDIPNSLNGPSGDHLFGTDDQGRDILSRVLYGARTSVLIGFGAVAVAALIAGTAGIISGYYGGLFDLLFQRLIDTWQSFPGLIFIIFIVSIFGNDMVTLILALGFLFSAGSSRVIRSATISDKQNVYVEAGRMLGASSRRIMLRYILPNVFPVILIGVSIQIGFVILIESSLSFLGFGVPPPFPSWGRMLQEAQSQMRYHPYLALFPGLAIALTVYSFNMFGDAVRDVLDPRLRGSR